MNILYLDWPCFGGSEVLKYFERMGDSVTKFSHPDYDLRVSKGFTDKVCQLLSENEFDFCFSYNFSRLWQAPFC
jgi:spore maturation protein CgeB